MQRIVPISIGILLAVLAWPVGVSLAGEGIRVSPSAIQKRVDPGSSLEQVISIHNPGATQQKYYPMVRDITGNDESGAPIFADDQHTEKIGAELSSWSTLSVSELVVPAGGDASVKLTVQVPANAPIGGAFGAVIFATEPPNLTRNESAVSVGFSVGSLVAIRVGDDGSDSASVREFRSDKAIYGAPSVSFSTRIENTGTALERPYGEIQVFDMFGRFISSVSFNETLGGLLPKQLRMYVTEWSHEGFALGRYKAKLIAIYGDSVKKSLVAETTFWVLPGIMMLEVAGGALVLFLIAYFWIRSYIRRMLKRGGVSGGQSSGRPVSFFAVFIAIVAVTAILAGIIFFLLA